MSDDPFLDALPDYLADQRWFASSDSPMQIEVTVDEPVEWLRHLLVRADGDTYQLVLAPHDDWNPPEFLRGHGEARLPGWHDALLDGDASLALLGVVTEGRELAERVRGLGAEQSNTSVVYDERLIMKLFRRLVGGPNLDVEVTEALTVAGFNHVAEPLGVWRRSGRDLAIVQPFLLGATDGWHLALTSLRDFLAGGADDPGDAGGDFGSEASRLGQLTARMHLALADAFGAGPGDPAAWAESVQDQLRLHGVDGGETLLADLRAARPGQAIRVHGDFHLAQVLRTDTGWYVLDFEGEPARPAEERRRPSSPLKDVAGMLRSLQYAGAVALFQRAEGSNIEGLAGLASAWENHNRAAFLDAYFTTKGIDALLPPEPGAVLAAMELEKAAYELGYERSYRPDWVAIPDRAIRRLLGER